MRLEKLGRKVGGMTYGAVGAALSRFERRSKDRSMRSVMAKIEARLS
jgi:hypothetical protein